MTTKTRTRKPKHPVIDWRLNSDGEVFSTIVGNFDINRVKQLLQKKPRAIEQMSIADVRELLHPRTGFYAFRVSVNWDRVDTDDAIDLSIPVIIADLGKTHFPIDGWHRIARAAETGVESLPCVVLTKTETNRVRS